MDKKLKQALHDVYRAPIPTKKAKFLKQHRRLELGRGELIVVQAGYICWWIWAASLGVFGLILWIAPQTKEWSWWATAAFTPFLALLAVTQNGRSRFYNMDELELVCRIPRRSAVLTRMVVLGVFHLILLAGLTPPLSMWSAAGVVQTGVYLLTPYLLTAAMGMELSRRIRGRECLLACGSAATLVSALGALLANQRPVLYHRESLPMWLWLLTAAMIATGLEITINLKESEEVQWN